MGRVISIVLGGAALALFVPALFHDQMDKVNAWWTDVLPGDWHPRLLQYGGGIFAGLALVLIAIRGKD